MPSPEDITSAPIQGPTQGAGSSPAPWSKPRRPHRKSRTGCADCRTRRVKCDEKRPVCTACARRDRPCVYPPTHDRHGGSNSNSPTSHGSHNSPDASHLHHQPPHNRKASLAALDALIAFPRTVQSRGNEALKYDLNDLALMHHWSFVAAASICLAESEVELWARGFPEIGFQHPFVAHGLLSVAALHLANASSDDLDLRAQHTNRAIFHHNASLNGFRQAVAATTADNSEALFIWSMLNLIYVLGISVHDPITSSPSNKDMVLGAEWIPMLLGVGAVLMPIYPFLAGGRMQTFLDIGNFSHIDLDDVNDDAMDVQMQRISETWDASGDATTYQSALVNLRRANRFVAQFKDMQDSELANWGYNRAWSGPMIFIHMAPEEYFTLLRQRQPPALVLFAFFGATLHEMRHYWFIQDLGKRIVEVVDELLGSYWRPWIAFALEHVGATRGRIS